MLCCCSLFCYLPLHSTVNRTMDQYEFENYQYDSASSYGGLPIVDDTSSVVSGFTTSTHNRPGDDLESLSSLSISGPRIPSGNHANKPESQSLLQSGAIDEELDGVLDDLKDESAVELPPHACRCGLWHLLPRGALLILAFKLLWYPLSCVRSQMSCLFKMVL